jgi:hypothetical protein
MSRNRPKKLSALIETVELAGDFFGRRQAAWSVAVGDLLDTPRALKFSLNAVIRAWERIHGEVDIDELIILTALRYRAGPVYSFLIRRALDLRLLGRLSSLDRDDDKKERQQQLDELRTEWKEALAKVDANRLAVEALMGDLFPSSHAITGRQNWLHSNRLQSVASSRGSVYLDRIAAGALSKHAVRDQTVLRYLDAMARGKIPESFAETFVTSRTFAEITVFFDDALRQRRGELEVSTSSRLSAASTMLEIQSNQHPNRMFWEGATHHLIKHWVEKGTGDPAYITWATEEILKRIPNNLFKATELYLDLFRDMHISTEAQSSVRDEILAKARSVFLELPPGDFAALFPAHFPYTLSYLVRLDTKGPSDALRTRPQDWAWLKGQILSGLRERPDILIPQVLPIFGTYGPQPGPYETYKFIDHSVAEFFGEDRARFYELIAQPFTPHPNLDANFKRLLPLAAGEAQLISAVLAAGGTPTESTN